MRQYDGIGRAHVRDLTVGGTTYQSSCDYIQGSCGDGNTSPLLWWIAQPGENCSYIYDDVGNITSETRNGLTVSYAYDKIGQLIRVNDPGDPASGSAGTTWTYEYDRGGNMLAKRRYAYTTGELGGELQSITYAYGDTNWKDKLTAYNGTPITLSGSMGVSCGRCTKAADRSLSSTTSRACAYGRQRSARTE